MTAAAGPLALPSPVRARWSLLRAGIQNVWEYDDRRFVFEHGRLLLRGQNEAGKTKALELLFPFLLDADLRPERLDPFGHTARAMRWNLINEADPASQLRVGYLWLEFGRRVEEAGPGGPAREEFCTLGAGLKARRGSPEVEAWFFVTSRRPDQDVEFLAEDRRPLARPALVELLGTDGQVFDRRADYRRAVNARLFGMADEQYDALIETLLKLRRPQLSKALDLEELSSLLSASLPPLDRAVVGPIAEGFERLDHHRAELEALEATLKKLRAFEGVYRTYARAVAKGRALEVTRAESAYQRARADARERATERDRLVARRDELSAAGEALAVRAIALAERLRALEGSDAYRAAQELDAAEVAAKGAEGRAAEAGKRAVEDESLAGRADLRREESAREVETREAELARSRGLAAERAGDAALAGAHGAVEALATKGDAEGAAAALVTVRAQREGVLSELKSLGAALRRAEDAWRVAEDRAREKAHELEAAREALRAAEEEAGAAEERWILAFERWCGGVVVAPRPPPLDPDAPADPAGLRAAVETSAGPVRNRLATDQARALARLEELERDQTRMQGERDALASAPHPLPPLSPWRAARPEGRPGAPLFLACDFGPGAAGLEAGLEAALESAGLLDAWIDPGGVLRDPASGDVLIRSSSASGRTLAEVLVPVAAGGLEVESARAALASIGWAEPGEEPEGECWVSGDGRFRLGALRGAWMKQSPSWVGATAREAERLRRIAELDARLTDLGASVLARRAEAGLAAGQLETLSKELASFPPGEELATARIRAVGRAEEHARAAERHRVAESAAAAAEARKAEAATALDSAAREAGLAAWARDAEGLAERTRRWVSAAEALVVAALGLRRALELRARESAAAAEARDRATRSREAVQGATGAAAAARERAEALRAICGKAGAEVLASLEAARAELESVNRDRTANGREVLASVGDVGRAQGEAERAETDVGEREADRQTAAAGFRSLAAAGVLAATGLAEATSGAEVESFTAALELARAVDASVEGAGTPEERERAEDRLVKRQQELALELPPDMKVLPGRAAEALHYQFTWLGRTRPAAEVVGEMEADARARVELLGREESGLLEAFLSGEAHEHLAQRLREARSLVNRMNAALEERTTAAGAQVRLDWDLDAAASDEAREAVPLFLKSGALLSDKNRRALRGFLERRLAEARAAEAEGGKSLQERLLEVLDYRSWYRFGVEHRSPGEAWAKLTRKAHAAGSGGRKAVMLHLPLFAAATAFYDSAGPGALRVIALDEAFAGIDRPTRAKLMGLLAEFDLDFIMTSFEEWGCYAELDGLATYHLSREPGQRGVYAEHFLWNGHEKVLVEAS